MRRWIGYGALFLVVLGCRKAIVRGEEDGCEDGRIEGITFGERDLEACVPPDALREGYGLRGCSFACRKDDWRDGHQQGWERCFVEGYASIYTPAIYEASCPEVVDTDDTALEPDGCEALQIGPDLALRSRVIVENQLQCLPVHTGLVDSEAAFVDLFDCDDGAPPDPDVDFETEDVYVEFGAAFGLGVALGVYDDGGQVYVLHENGCPGAEPPPPFRSLRLTVVPKGQPVDTDLACNRQPCD